jgi:hypothetical protein
MHTDSNEYVWGLARTLIRTHMYAHTRIAQRLKWGWRVPFLAGALLGLVGIFLRTQVRDIYWSPGGDIHSYDYPWLQIQGRDGNSICFDLKICASCVRVYVCAYACGASVHRRPSSAPRGGPAPSSGPTREQTALIHTEHTSVYTHTSASRSRAFFLSLFLSFFVCACVRTCVSGPSSVAWAWCPCPCCSAWRSSQPS